jgi:cytochrome P450
MTALTAPWTLFERLTSAEGLTDPYPLYAALREHGPLVRLDPTSFIAASYSAVDAALRDPALGVSADGAFGDRSLLNSNPPDHTRMRRLMSGVFSPRRIGDLEDAIRRLSQDLIGGMRGRGDGADLMADFAYRLPVNVICELLGVPVKDREWFRPVAGDLTVLLDGVGTEDEMTMAIDAVTMIRKYFAAQVRERADDPRDDLVSLLSHDGSLSEDEVLANLTLLLVAGFETTTNLIGNGMRILFDHPQWMEGMAQRPGDYVEEFLRYDSPVQVTSRTALRDTTLLGTPVPQGSYVMILIGSANRDPQRFADPDTFNPLRPNNVPISFGAGAHFCLGAALARLEARIAFPLLRGLRPAGEPVRRPRLVLRGYESMPVSFAA